MDGRMGSTYLITGRKHTSTNLKVLAWAFFFFILFDMVWVRYDTVRYWVRYGYGYGYGYGIWFWLWVGQKIYDTGQGWNIYIMRKGEGGGGTDAQGTYIPTSL